MNVDEPSQLISVETSLRMTWRDPRLNITIPDGLSDDFVLFGPDVMKYIWSIPDYQEKFVELAKHAEEHIEDEEAPLFLRFVN